MTRPTARSIGAVLGFSALLVAIPAPGQAQVSVGPLFTVGDDSGFGLGARTDFDLAGPLALDDAYFRDLFGSVTATYSFMGCGRDSGCGMVELGGNANIPLTARSASLTAYAGAGFHIVASFERGEDEERDDFGEHGDRDDTVHVERGRSRADEGGSDVSVGPNLIGGLQFDTLGLDWFLEGKLGFSHAGQFLVSAGFLFR